MTDRTTTMTIRTAGTLTEWGDLIAYTDSDGRCGAIKSGTVFEWRGVDGVFVLDNDDILELARLIAARRDTRVTP